MSPARIDWARLTDRQHAAVVLAMHGIRQRDAASNLGITRSTLKEHLDAAERRLGLEAST